MQDTICCYVRLVYDDFEWIVDIPSDIKVSVFLKRLEEGMVHHLQGQYLYEWHSKKILDPTKTFFENGVKSGAYLYFI